MRVSVSVSLEENRTRVLAHAKMEGEIISVSVRESLEENRTRVLAHALTLALFSVPGAGIEC